MSACAAALLSAVPDETIDADRVIDSLLMSRRGLPNYRLWLFFPFRLFERKWSIVTVAGASNHNWFCRTWRYLIEAVAFEHNRIKADLGI